MSARAGIKSLDTTATVVHTTGTRVWVRDDVESWIKAEVLKVDGDELLVRTEKGKERRFKPDDCPLQNPDTRGVEDMTRLSYLHEPGVLWNLSCRYMLDDIYTYTGTILIAVNPFASLPHLYGTHMMEQYRGVDLGELSPHVYAIADAAYRQMRKEMKGQSILVSGESGAGKTETSKLLMKYLAYMGGYTDTGEARAESGSSAGVEQQVLESNPVLEAFGNAKTVRNDNSSRFGKYVEINFNKAGVISGAAIRTYLLERSRVVAVNNPERNYHIFYQLCYGANPEEKARWRLRSAKDYHYLKQSTCFELAGVDNAEEFKVTVRAMSRVGITELDCEAVFRTVAAILNLGNISFVVGADGESSVVAPGTAQEYIKDTADLLAVPVAGLIKALTTRTRQTHDGPIVSPLDVKAATENRDTLAKIIYSKMFDWLVACINGAIGEDPNCAASVGVLDIYGFESFNSNDFEQFCINLANEKLQQHFNQHVFKMEQAEYEREQIDWSYIEFVDNQDVLDLIEGKLGILDLLDEQCRFPTATGADYAQKLFGSGLCKESKRFSKPKTSQTSFTIDHYAGGVTYSTNNFLDKNKDFIVAEHQSLLGGSTQPFVSALFTDAASQDGGAPADKAGKGLKAFKFNSVGSQFKKQLTDLMTQLHAMEPHYIRCIKPNSFNKPSLFENSNALQQLRCGGVLEAVRISCAGFPSKRPYPDFVDHFWPLAPDLLRNPDLDDRAIAEATVIKAGIRGYQLGTTKIFLRAGQMALLDKVRTDKLNLAATTIQRVARGHLARRQYRRLKEAVVTIQAAVRGMFARREARSLRRTKAAINIQRHWRGYAQRVEYRAAVSSILLLQSLWRGRNARSRLQTLRRQHSALVLQRAWRMYRARSRLLQTRAATVTFQGAWRVRVARLELRHLRQEAREGTRLLEDKKALEARVAEITGTLNVVQEQRHSLRQDLKAEMSAKQEALTRVAALEAEVASLTAVAAEVTNGSLQAARDECAKLAEELAELRRTSAEAETKAAADRAELQKQLRAANDYIQRQLVERADFERKFHAMKDDLVNRLQNACNQRDEARAQVLELQNEAEKQREVLQGKEKEIEAAKVAAVAASAAAAASTTPGTLPNGTPEGVARATSLIHRVTQAGGTGYARAIYDTYMTSGATPPSRTPGTPSDEAGSMRTPLTPASSVETEMERKTRELQAKQQQLIQEKRKQEEERLLTSISSNMGFNRGRPVAAIVVFRCCLQWRAFQADRATIFERIITVIGFQVEKQQDDNACLAYWLTNTVTLLHMLQKNIKPASGSQYGRRPATASTARSVLGGLFGRSGANLANAEASIHGGGVGGFKQVEAKYPALLFKQQLDAFVQKIFPMMRDNVKKLISPMLANCIHTPKGMARAGSSMRRTADAGAQQQQSKHWSDILKVFDELLDTVKNNHVPQVLVQALFKQLFSFVNVQLFNQLLLRRECCSFSNGEYVKTGLAQVESWIQAGGREYVADSWDELKFIRQAVTFLVIGNKPKKTLEDITADLCPVLSIQQLYRISTMYWDDRYNTETVSGDVLGKMKQLMVDTNSSSSHSFLLDDDSTLPFAAAEVLGAMDDKDLYNGLPLPEPLKEPDGTVGGFVFLEKELRFA